MGTAWLRCIRPDVNTTHTSSGDIALRILDHARDKHASRDVHVHILDINPDMLSEGKKRFAKTMYHNGACPRASELPWDTLGHH